MAVENRLRAAIVLGFLLAAAAAGAQPVSGDQNSGPAGSPAPSDNVELHPLSDQDRALLQDQNAPSPSALPRHDGDRRTGPGPGGSSSGLINIRTAHDHDDRTFLVSCGKQRLRLTIPPSVWCCRKDDTPCQVQMDEDNENGLFPPLHACPYGAVYNRAYRQCQDVKKAVAIDGCLSPCMGAWLLDKANSQPLAVEPPEKNLQTEHPRIYDHLPQENSAAGSRDERQDESKDPQ